MPALLIACKLVLQVQRLAWQAGQDITKYPEKAHLAKSLYQRLQPLSCTAQACLDSPLSVTLQPLDIRTFQLSWAKA